MTFKEMIQEFKNRDMFEIRTEEHNYFEGVFKRSEWIQCSQFLDQHEGPPVKAKGQKPDSAIKKVTDTFGGVRDNQIFYQNPSSSGGWGLIVWPWTDEQYFTVKLFAMGE